MVFLETAACGQSRDRQGAQAASRTPSTRAQRFLVDPHDPAELIGGHNGLAQSPNSPPASARRQHRVAEDFTWEKYGRQIDEVLDELSADGTIRPAKHSMPDVNKSIARPCRSAIHSMVFNCPPMAEGEHQPGRPS